MKLDELDVRWGHSGLVFPKDRSSGPYKAPHYVDSVEGLTASNTSFGIIDELVDMGWVEINDHYKHKIAFATLTYMGHRERLKQRDFDFDKFRGRGCCDKAIPVFCVCRLKTLCPDHGHICRGTHD